MDSQYLIIDSNVVPDVFKKVIETKKLLESGKYKSVNEALEKTKLSRTAFYKYKNHIFASDDSARGSIVTLAFTLDDISGILSEILSILAKMNMNVLTINQNIPINGIANITISFRMGNDEISIDNVVKCLEKVDGVNNVNLLAMSI